ncbi:MAG: hypothetical protein CL678_09725 [Bdellovibrionaceae bacterium]|nr:hypothetical protein [Pseudobdellovibrionaceae bacterium]|tara:strand:- start:4150 stop:5487 length:1338 start_codon:yes stop_codon:yes gene_type:complete
MKYKILLVEDDMSSRSSLERFLFREGYEVVSCADGEEALSFLRSSRFDLVVSDIRMPTMNGMELFKAIQSLGMKIPMILMTAHAQVDDAVYALKKGAVDFLIKPFKRKDLLSAIQKTVVSVSFSREEFNFEEYIAESVVMKNLLQKGIKVAPTNAHVLIHGESGTGKEFLSHFIHKNSTRSAGPFISINCSSIPENLIESELFGYVKGAFTGAEKTREGLFQVADGGTLFLDEVGDMPLNVQVKLLRAIQEGEVRKVGSTEIEKVDVRIVSATHQNLSERVSQNLFRRDLMYRLEVVQLNVPPLRDRKEDLPALIQFFIEKHCKKHQKEITKIDSEVLIAFAHYSWPGNIRELSNVIERGVILSDQTIDLSSLPYEIQGALDNESLRSKVEIPLGTPLKEVEELLIQKTLEMTDGDKEVTARLLGINSRTIYRRLEKQKELSSKN